MENLNLSRKLTTRGYIETQLYGQQVCQLLQLSYTFYLSFLVAKAKGKHILFLCQIDDLKTHLQSTTL